MRIGFVGTGKVATAFGRYLHACDIAVSGFFDRHPEKAAHASQATGTTPFANADEAAAHSDIILITTQDDNIDDACAALCRRGAVTAHHLIGHMSGAQSSSILKTAEAQGAATFSLHPLQAFADEQTALNDLPKTFFSLESEDQRAEALEKILAAIGNPFFRISADKKTLYHLSACVLSNYLVTVMDSGLAVLESSGVDPRQGFAAMQPLIMGTLANITKTGTTNALTGPIARGDARTIRQHMDALDAHGLGAFKEFYTYMGLKTLDLAERQILKTPDKAEAIRQSLEKT